MEIRKTKEFLYELVGTMILLAFGTGSVAMVVLFEGGKGDYTTITFGWGIGVMLGILVAAPSGAHLNPALTLALALTRRFSWSKVLPYILGQLLGAFLGAAITYFVFYGKIKEMETLLSEDYSGIFATFPAVVGYGYFDQIIGTAFLVFIVLSIGAYQPQMNNLVPLMVGFLVIGIGISYGGMHGYAINPARDLGPRIFTALVGMKNTGFNDISVWLLGPVVSPFLGGVLGALSFDLLRKEKKEI